MKIRTEAELTGLFAKLGAKDPVMWARSQLAESIPQLARFIFLREAWKLVVTDNDRDWILEQLRTEATAPGGAIVPALRAALSAGARDEDLSTIVRVMQWRLLARLCDLLDDPGPLEDDVRDITWRLYQTDDRGQPIVWMTGLHESVLELEPSGHEMKAE